MKILQVVKESYDSFNGIRVIKSARAIHLWKIKSANHFYLSFLHCRFYLHCILLFMTILAVILSIEMYWKKEYAYFVIRILEHEIDFVICDDVMVNAEYWLFQNDFNLSKKKAVNNFEKSKWRSRQRWSSSIHENLICKLTWIGASFKYGSPLSVK